MSAIAKSLRMKWENVRAAFSEILDVPKPTLSECLSVLSILSPSFYDFLRDAARFKEAEIDMAALAIAGRPGSPDAAFVTQLITNAVDADKLDYMFRDSHATGVPIGIDLERLLYKLFCIRVGGEHIPEGMQKIFAAADQAVVLATDLSGHQLAYDLAAARSILFERIYLHHKTRAAERVVLSIMAELQMHPIVLLGHDDGYFSSYGGIDLPQVELLRQRQLPERVLAPLSSISTSTPRSGRMGDLYLPQT